MKRLLLIAGTSAFLGACSSGGCDSGNGNKAAPAGESTSLPGGAGTHGGTGEAVSFQGLGKKDAGSSAQGAQAAAAAQALGGSGAAEPAATPALADAPQSVICGGFPNLAADCKTDPAFDQVKKKCCPTGQVDRCQAIPGGARLVGRGCTAAK